jgi:hypothetical protein
MEITSHRNSSGSGVEAFLAEVFWGLPFQDAQLVGTNNISARSPEISKRFSIILGLNSITEVYGLKEVAEGLEYRP